MTAREQEILALVKESSSGDTYVTPSQLARVLARLEPQKPGAAGEQALVWHLSGMRCGAFHNSKDFYIDSREHVTCPACLKLMRDGTGKEPQPPAPPAAPEPGKSRGEEVAEKMVAVAKGSDHKEDAIGISPHDTDNQFIHVWPDGSDLARDYVASLRKWIAAAVDAKCAAAEGEARRKALADGILAITKAIRLSSVGLSGGDAVLILSKLDAAAAPAGEGSKAND